MDSAGDLPVEWIKEYQIDIIPINVHLDDKVFLQSYIFLTFCISQYLNGFHSVHFGHHNV